jgi:hypothetical protein
LGSYDVWQIQADGTYKVVSNVAIADTKAGAKPEGTKDEKPASTKPEAKASDKPKEASKAPEKAN